MDVIRTIEAQGQRKDVPEFRSGDRVKVHVRVVEGDKSRIQVFEGDVVGALSSRATRLHHPRRQRQRG